jgi:cytochrome b
LNVNEDRSNNRIVVWDPLVRIFHWSLVFFFFLAYFIEGEWLKLHAHAGYTVALLVLFRLLWGFIGFGFARFHEFLVPPRQIVSYLQQLSALQAKRFIGHNPAGGIMIVALFFALLSTTFSGMCLFAMEGSGPLAATAVTKWPGTLLEEIHDLSANFTLLLILIHVAGVIYSSRLHKENLTIAMLTGLKEEGRLDNVP